MATKIPQTTVLELPHTLTNEEKLEQQSKIMRLLDTKQDLTAELASITSQFKRDKADNEKSVGEVEADINRVRGEIKVGVEMRKYRCNIIRNRDTQEVEYSVIDGPRAGEIVKRTPFEQEDWNAIMDASQVDIDFPENPDAPDEDVIRAQASLTDEPEVQPTKDEQGRVIAGPETDAYNLANPGDTTYRHLSEHIDFAPQVTSVQAADAGAEQTDAADVDRTDQQDNDDSNDDEPTGDDKPGDDEPTAPNPPKRKAKRTPPKPE